MTTEQKMLVLTASAEGPAEEKTRSKPREPRAPTTVLRAVLSRSQGNRGWVASNETLLSVVITHRVGRSRFLPLNLPTLNRPRQDLQLTANLTRASGHRDAGTVRNGAVPGKRTQRPRRHDGIGQEPLNGLSWL